MLPRVGPGHLGSTLVGLQPLNTTIACSGRGFSMATWEAHTADVSQGGCRAVTQLGGAWTRASFRAHVQPHEKYTLVLTVPASAADPWLSPQTSEQKALTAAPGMLVTDLPVLRCSLGHCLSGRRPPIPVRPGLTVTVLLTLRCAQRTQATVGA